MENEKNKDGGNTPDPFADAAINNVVNGHVAATGSTSPLVITHKQNSPRLVSLSTYFLFDCNTSWSVLCC